MWLGCRKKPHAQHVASFLCTLDVKHHDPTDRCITWYELFILYRLRGFDNLIADPLNKTHRRPTAHLQLLAFKNTVRATVKRALLDSPQLSCPDAMITKQGQLSGVASMGKHPALRCNVHITAKEAAAIAQQVIKMSRNFSGTKIDAFINQSMNLKLIELNRKGRATWASAIPRLSARHDEYIYPFLQYTQHWTKRRSQIGYRILFMPPL